MIIIVTLPYRENDNHINDTNVNNNPMVTIVLEN